MTSISILRPVTHLTAARAVAIDLSQRRGHGCRACRYGSVVLYGTNSWALYGTCWYHVKGLAMKRTQAKAVAKPATGNPVRERILCAAFEAFVENGYAATTTLNIATRASVSKRELYAHFGSKQAILVACITGRAPRMRLPPGLPPPRDRRELAAALTAFGTILTREVSHPTVMATFRLAIAEAERSPEVAEALDRFGRDAARAALAGLLAEAQAAGLIGPGAPVAMARQYLALLWEDLMVELLLRVADPPAPGEIKRRAAKATAALLALHPPLAG